VYFYGTNPVRGGMQIDFSSASVAAQKELQIYNQPIL